MADINSNSVFICNNDRVDEINQRILARNTTTDNLDILFDSRPESTKYTLLPSVNNKHHDNIINSAYNVKTCFNPGNTKGPWSGYVTNVNDESVLRNQVCALQKFPQAEYIPNSNSDLYTESILNNSYNNSGNYSNVEQIFPNLFNNNIYPQNNENLDSTNHLDNLQKEDYLRNLGENLFNNYTSQQIKDKR